MIENGQPEPTVDPVYPGDDVGEDPVHAARCELTAEFLTYFLSGVDPREIGIRMLILGYLAAHRDAPETMVDLAKRTGLSRPTLYTRVNEVRQYFQGF